ncbi:hypothetical protein HYX08_04675 [Candidatus Woesearchaeota archaeon]|nr:hypothetical protein [Candidatus Woesearchaeota archaeon]
MDDDEISEEDALLRLYNLRDGEKIVIYDGPSGFGYAPKQTIVRRGNKIHVFDGSYSALFNSPPRRTIVIESSSDCFVATAVYGDPEAPQVQVLRDFKDNVLMKHPLGKRFVDFYYSGAGKRTAGFIKEHLPSAIPLIRKGIDVLVERYSAQRK